MDWIEAVGFAGTALTLGAWAMRCSLRLRIMGIASSVAFLTYGALSQSWPVIATELMLLPLNAVRLWQLVRLRRAAAAGGAGVEWLLPHARRERLPPGAALVTEGRAAQELTLVLAGSVCGLGPVRGLVGSARPFEREPERRTLRALDEVVVARVDLALLEALALETPLLAPRVLRLALEAARAEGGPGTSAAPTPPLRPVPRDARIAA